MLSLQVTAPCTKVSSLKHAPLACSTTTMEQVMISLTESTSPTALFNIGDMCYAGEPSSPGSENAL